MEEELFPGHVGGSMPPQENKESMVPRISLNIANEIIVAHHDFFSIVI